MAAGYVPMSMDRKDELVRLLFEELKASGGTGRRTELIEAVGTKAGLRDDVPETRWTWRSNLSFAITVCVRAGFLRDEGGALGITEAGEDALSLPSGRLYRTASKLYRQTLAPREQAAETEEPEPLPAPSGVDLLTKAQEDARAAIDEFLDSLGPYDFQNLVAELLKAMGYYIRHISPPGADGGLDILAFRDPLGSEGPHIKVQVKHRAQKLDAREVRELTGTLRKDSDIGLLVSSGGFTREAEREIAQSQKHLDKIDRTRFIELWKQHYSTLSDRGKLLFPLVPVHFLAPEASSQIPLNPDCSLGN